MPGAEVSGSGKAIGARPGSRWARWLPLTWLLPREALRAAREKRLMWLVGAMLLPLPLVVDVVSLPGRAAWWGLVALRRWVRGRRGGGEAD